MKTKPTKKRSTKSTSKPWSTMTICTVVIVTFAIAVLAFSYFQSHQDAKFPNIKQEIELIKELGRNLETNIHHYSEANVSSQSYEELLRRANYLTEKYKNLTSKLQFEPSSVSPPNHLSIGAPATRDIVKPSISKVEVSQRDVVFGIAHNTDAKNLAVFCGSFRKHNKEAQVIIFINNDIPNRHKSIATKYNIELKEYDLNAMSSIYSKYHASSLRWVLLHQYLKSTNALTTRSRDRVLLIDVRDSSFQSDPFSSIMPSSSSTSSTSSISPSMFVFHGVETMTIAQCGWNGGWVKDCFGQQTLSDIGHNHILCSGVSMGTMTTMAQYAALMSYFLSGSHSLDLFVEGISPSSLIVDTHRVSSMEHHFPTCERNGVDQGVHNVIMHSRLLKDGTVSMVPQRGSLVANMQARVAVYSRDTMKVVNQLGQPVAIVHQYDRDNQLQTDLFREYVDWVDASDFNALWAEESTCQAFSHQQDVDLFKGQCDLKMEGGATSAASCCRPCQALPHCQAFTFYSGVCFLKSCKTQRSGGSGASLPGAVSGYLKA